MAAHASKRAKEDNRRKKEKVQEEKESAKLLKEETANNKEKDTLVEMLQNARNSRMCFLKGSAPPKKWKIIATIKGSAPDLNSLMEYLLIS